MKIFFLIVLFISTMLSNEKYHQVEIQSNQNDIVNILHSIGVEFDHFRFDDNKLKIAVSDSDLIKMNDNNIIYSILIEDLTSYYQSRFTNSESRDFPDGSMGGYYIFDEVVAKIDEFHQNYPNIVSEKISIGTTLEGRNVWAFRVTNLLDFNGNEPQVLYTGLHHAREPMSMMNLIYFIIHLTENYGIDEQVTHLVDNRDMWFVPVVNPDGYVYNHATEPNGGGMHRKNKRSNGCTGYDTGVDLNRNYPFLWGYDDSGSDPSPCGQTYRGTSPESESETQAITNLVENHDFKLALNYHSYSDLLIYPFGYTYNNPMEQEDLDIFIEYGEQMVQYNGYALGTGPDLLYPVNGEACDYMYGEHGIFAYTPEIGGNSDGFWPATSRILPLAEENLFPNLFLALNGGSNYTIQSQIGEGPYEQGSSYPVYIQLSNSGLGDSNGDITLSFSSSQYVEFEIQELEFDGMDARSSIDLQDIAYFEILPGAPNGTIENITIAVSDEDGYESLIEIQFIIGETTVVFYDNFDTNQGWQAGAIGDNASSGIWERAIPNGTELYGQYVQPNQDHSDEGAFCYVTGNGVGNGAGFDDIDNGRTTLTSPTFDLSDYNAAFVSYWRWYTNNLGDGPNQDNWEVEVSNNGGLSWDTIENTTQSNNSWEYHEYLINDYIDLSDNVTFRFIAEDSNDPSLVEAALDDFSILVVEANTVLGDINFDGTVDVLDVVRVVNIVIGNYDPSQSEFNAADLNNDDVINVLDIVSLVNIILGL